MADPMVDLWDINVGFSWDDDSAPFRLRPEGYQLEWTGRVREVTAKPIVGVGRLTDPDAMADILRSGAWDLIGAARPGMADPFLPRKIEEGRYDQVRECTGSNFCIASETTGAGLSCVQNSTIGEEFRRGWHPERFEPARDRSQSVLVVGAGPAGLECARVLGERGFEQVHVVDAAAEAGGHLRWVRRLPGMAGLGRIVDYRTTQIRRLPGVDLILNRRLDADDVLGYGADLVVVATGARWIRPDLSVTVLTPEDVMVDDRPPGGAVVVWDAEGGAVGAGVAERLAAAGRRVTVVTPYAVAAPLLDATFEGAGLRRRLHELGVFVRTETSLVRCDDRGVVVADAFGEESVVFADSVVAAVQRVSDEALYVELAAQAGDALLFRIGDCVSPRAVWRCTAGGHRLGREIDTDSPAIPLPTRREG
jgi:dimethylamine/trimethylamine dehydrogenase